MDLTLNEAHGMYDFIEKPSAPTGFISTGVDKLDLLLEGGIPRGFFTLILGVPGSGLEIFMKQLASFGKTLYFTTDETQEEIIQTMKRFGWKVDNIEIVDIASRYTESIMLSQEKRVSAYQKRAGINLRDLILEGSGGVPLIKENEPDFLAMLGDRMRESPLPEKILLNSIDFFLDQYPHNDVIRTVQAMKVANLKNKSALFVSLTKGVYGDLFERRMEGIADCVLELEVIKKGSTFDRYLSVKKMKNYARKIGMARYTIDKDGFVLEMIERIM